MKRTNYFPTLGQLQYRAKKHGITIRKFKRGEEDSYMLIGISKDEIIALGPMTLVEIELGLNDLENQAVN